MAVVAGATGGYVSTYGAYRKCEPLNKGVRGGILEILRFKMSVRGSVFNVNGDNSKQKVILHEIDVGIAISM